MNDYSEEFKVFVVHKRIPLIMCLCLCLWLSQPGELASLKQLRTLGAFSPKIVAWEAHEAAFSGHAAV